RHTTFNALRAFWHGITGSITARIDTNVAAPMRPHYRRLTRYSAAFALTADLALLTLGGSLKFRERLSARLGDMLSQLYIASAVLKRYEDEGRQPEDAVLVHWAVQDALYRVEEALDGVLWNFPNTPLAILLRIATLPLGRLMAPPFDALSGKVAELLTRPGLTRDRLTTNCHVPADEEDPVGALEAALASVASVQGIEKKLRQFERSGKLAGNPIANVRDMPDAVYAAGGISTEEYELLRRYHTLRDRVIAVDDFPQDLSEPAARADARRHPA